MTLLAICQNAARQIPIPIPTVIVGSTDSNAALLYGMATRSAQDVYRKCMWTCMQREHTFTTVASQADYALPGDFGRFIDETAWDRTNYWAMRGPKSPQEWQFFKSSILGGSLPIMRRYRIKPDAGVNSFFIDPTPPETGNTLVFEYVSRNWCQSAIGVGQATWAADTDVLQPDANDQFNEYLVELGVVWRMLERLGLAYSEAKDEFERELSMAKSRDGGAPTLSIVPQPYLHFIDGSNVQDGNFPGP